MDDSSRIEFLGIRFDIRKTWRRLNLPMRFDRCPTLAVDVDRL